MTSFRLVWRLLQAQGLRQGLTATIVALGVALMVTFLSPLPSTWSSALAQSREVAVMRVLGARRGQVVAVVLGATFLVSLATGGAMLSLGW